MHILANLCVHYLKKGIFICNVIDHDRTLTVSIVDRTKSMVSFLASCVLESDSVIKVRMRERERERERERGREREENNNMYDVTAIVKHSTLVTIGTRDFIETCRHYVMKNHAGLIYMYIAPSPTTHILYKRR